MKLTILILAILGVLLHTTPSHACTCFPPSIKGTYFDTETVNFVEAIVEEEIPPPSPVGNRQYILTITKNYKGCPPDTTVTVKTPAQSATCGVTLVVGRTYVLPLRAGPNPSIFLCDFIKDVGNLTPAEKFFLITRNVCCKGKCTCASGEPPVNCFRQPCGPPETPPCDEAVTCVDNFCGGCFAEWFNENGLPACVA